MNVFRSEQLESLPPEPSDDARMREDRDYLARKAVKLERKYTAQRKA
jgi:hypothetical protein